MKRKDEAKWKLLLAVNCVESRVQRPKYFTLKPVWNILNQGGRFQGVYSHDSINLGIIVDFGSCPTIHNTTYSVNQNIPTIEPQNDSFVQHNTSIGYHDVCVVYGQCWE